MTRVDIAVLGSALESTVPCCGIKDSTPPKDLLPGRKTEEKGAAHTMKVSAWNGNHLDYTDCLSMISGQGLPAPIIWREVLLAGLNAHPVVTILKTSMPNPMNDPTFEIRVSSWSIISFRGRVEPMCESSSSLRLMNDSDLKRLNQLPEKSSL